jgi:hypothetical protein
MKTNRRETLGLLLAAAAARVSTAATDDPVIVAGKRPMIYAWRLWQFPWRPASPGCYTILSRTSDSAGSVQPVIATWNPSGYLWNAIDRVGVTVEKQA